MLARDSGLGASRVDSVGRSGLAVVPAMAEGSNAVNPFLVKYSVMRSSLTQILVSPPTRAAINLPLRSDPANARRTESSLPSSAAFRSMPSSTRPSNDTDGGVPRRPVSDPDRAITRSATFNSAGSSISVNQRPKATAGTGIRRASRGITRSRPGRAIYATDSS